MTAIEVWFLRAAQTEPAQTQAAQNQPALSEAALTPGQLTMLAPEERERASRFRFEPDRHLYEASRVLLRTLLSRHVAVHPSEWQFEAEAFAKPRIVRPADTGLDFSLSHTNGLVSVAIAVGGEIGVDTEYVERRLDVSDVVERCFSSSERSALSACPPADRRLEFFKHWTLKESLAKALGLGLSAHLPALSFRIGRNGVDVVFEDGAPGDRDGWTCHLFQPTAAHVLAVSVRLRTAPALPLRVREAFLTTHSLTRQDTYPVQ